MLEWLYFHKVTGHLSFRYCTCFELEVLKVQIVDSLWNARSSHQRCSVRKGVLRNVATFTRKHLCQSLFFNKVAGLRPATLLKKRLWHTCFSVAVVFFVNFGSGGYFWKQSLLSSESNHYSQACRPVNGRKDKNPLAFPRFPRI